MTIIIKPADGQADTLKALIGAVNKVAGDTPVRVTSLGVEVPDAVGLKYLKATVRDANTAGYTVDNTRQPLITRHVDGTGGDNESPATPAAGDGLNPDLTIGGRTPEGDLPGGYEGVPADARSDSPASGDRTAAQGETPAESTGGDSAGAPTPAKTTTPAKKSTPAKKTTAAAQQRASRTTSSRESQ